MSVKESFFRRNKNKLMAVFSVGLMIAFAAEREMRGDPGKPTYTVGTMGSKKITINQTSEYSQQLVLLEKSCRIVRKNPNTFQTEQIAFLPAILGGYISQPGASALTLVQEFKDPSIMPMQYAREFMNRGESVVVSLKEKQEAFYLLCQEAEQSGILVSKDEVQGVINNVEFIRDSNPEFDDRAYSAVHNLLLAMAYVDRAADAIVISRPQRDARLALEQKVSLNLVEFKALDYLDKVAVWSKDEIAVRTKKLYDLNKNNTPTTRPNDFSFGYLKLNQVQLEYIELPATALHQLVASGIPDEDARRYLIRHEEEFARDMGLLPAPTSAPATVPVKKAAVDFELARERVIKAMIAEKKPALKLQITKWINEQLATDYLNYKTALSEARPAVTGGAAATAAKLPVTSLGVAYNSPEYLAKLALKVQERFKILPKVSRDLGLRTREELDKQSDVSEALMMVGRMQPVTASVYLTSFVKPLENADVHNVAMQTGLKILALYEPSPTFMSFSKNAKPEEYTDIGSSDVIFRVIDAVASHPIPFDEVADKVLADARMEEAANLAREDALNFIKRANQKKAPLHAQAETESRKLITTELLDSSTTKIEGLKFEGQVLQLFLNKAKERVIEADGPHSFSVFDMRATFTCYATQINQVKPNWTAANLAERQVEMSRALTNQIGPNVRGGFFRAADIFTRNQFVPAPNSRNSN